MRAPYYKHTGSALPSTSVVVDCTMRPFSFSVPSLAFAGKDIPAGIVVFLVALPLCLGIALASGAPLFAGVVGGIIGGVVVTLFSGSELSVSGPAAGLASIVASAIITLGSFPIFLTAIVLAGLLQIGIAAARAGSLGNFIPHSVIKGMLAAIGLTIILKQLPHAVGYDRQGFTDDEVAFAGSEWINIFLDPVRAFQSDILQPGAVVITLVCLTILLLWETPIIHRVRWLRVIPGALVSVIIGTLLNVLYGLVAPSWQLTVTAGHLVSLPVFSSLADVGNQLVFPDLSAVGRMDVWVIALTIAAIASIESVLSVEAVDKMDPQKRISDVNRELYAQGIGNTLSGLVGGIPVTSVIVRSSANVYAGGVTRLSSLIHGVLLLIAVVLIPSFLNLIPLACLASVLLIVGYKLSSIKLIRSMWSEGLPQFFPFIATFIAIVATDILLGVGIGLLVSVFFVVRSYHRRSITLVHDDRNWLLRFNKDMTFIQKVLLKDSLVQIPDGAHVIIDGTKSLYIDHDIYETLSDYSELAKHRNIIITYHNYFGKHGRSNHGRLPSTSAQ